MRMLTPRVALALAAIAFAAVVNAQCANTSYGNGVTCVKAAGYGGGGTNQTTKDLTMTVTAGHGVIVSAYQCWDSNCLTTGTATASSPPSPSSTSCTGTAT